MKQVKVYLSNHCSTGPSLPPSLPLPFLPSSVGGGIKTGGNIQQSKSQIKRYREEKQKVLASVCHPGLRRPSSRSSGQHTPAVFQLLRWWWFGGGGGANRALGRTSCGPKTPSPRQTAAPAVLAVEPRANCAAASIVAPGARGPVPAESTCRRPRRVAVRNLAGPSSAPAFYPKGDVPTRRGVLRFLPAAPSPTGEKEVPAASRCVHWSTQTQVREFVKIVYYIDFVSPSAYVKLWAVTKIPRRRHPGGRGDTSYVCGTVGGVRRAGSSSRKKIRRVHARKMCLVLCFFAMYYNSCSMPSTIYIAS